MFGYQPHGYNPYPAQYPQAVPDQLQQLRAPYQAQQPQQAPAQSGGILWCQGEAGAKAWPVSPGCTVQLMDSEVDCFYIKTVDQSGMPHPLRVFDFKERVNAPAAPHTGISTPEVRYATEDDINKLWAAVQALSPKKEDSNG